MGFGREAGLRVGCAGAVCGCAGGFVGAVEEGCVVVVGGHDGMCL